MRLATAASEDVNGSAPKQAAFVSGLRHAVFRQRIGLKQVCAASWGPAYEML